jgi:hypothetical protein
MRPCPPSIVRAPAAAWIVAKGALQRLQERRLIVLDLEQVGAAVLHDVRTQGALCEQGIAGHQHVRQVDLTEQRQRLGEFVLALANRQLDQHGAAATANALSR